MYLAPLVPLLYIMSNLLPSPSFLSPSSPFLFWLPLFLILLSFYRSSCNCHIYKARYWELLEGKKLEPWQGSPAYSWRCHYRRETGMFKSVATCFLPYMQQHVASRPTQNKAASCLSHWSVHNFQYNIDKTGTYPCWVWLYFTSLVPTPLAEVLGMRLIYHSAHLPVNSGSGWYVTMFVKCLVNTKVHYSNCPDLVLTHVDQYAGLNLNSCHITSAQSAFVPSSRVPGTRMDTWLCSSVNVKSDHTNPVHQACQSLTNI